MTHHRISVDVQKSSIQVSPETLVMTALDEVQWTGANARRFSIVFEGAGPFDRNDLDHAAATASRRPRVQGRFKYTVISADDPSVKLDPVIVVDEPPSDSNP